MFLSGIMLIIEVIQYYYTLCRAMSMLLPTWQDCHELWSKKRRRQIREQEAIMQSLQNLPPGKPQPAGKERDYAEGG